MARRARASTHEGRRVGFGGLLGRGGLAIVAIGQVYRPFAPVNQSAQPTDTLITKVILGTSGCLPACDRYFINGFKSEGFEYSYVNDRFVERVLGFCRKHLPRLQKEQASIEQRGGVRYPLMKIVDMYFWQIGYERGTGSRRE